MTPMILGGLHGDRAANFKVLVSPLSPGSVGRDVGHNGLL
jgi:hypothetical protein